MARQIADSLANISAQTERRLDRLTTYYPPAKPSPVSFDDYLPRALEHAQKDERFARELARSLYQAARFGGS